MVSSDCGGFFFVCAKFHGSKIAVFWPKFTISRVLNRVSVKKIMSRTLYRKRISDWASDMKIRP